MITLPLFVIEKIGSVWTLYQTVDCVTFEFPTKEEAEQAKKLLTTK